MMKRILIIIPNLGKGGAQKVFHQQLFLLSKHYEVKGCVFNWEGAFKDDKTDKVISLEIPAGNTYLSKAWYFIKRASALRKIKKALAIDVAISHLEGADYINLLSYRSERIICWIHGTKKYDQNIAGLLGIVRHKILMPVLYRRADKLVTVSRGIANELSNSLHIDKEKFKVIYNGLDYDEVSNLAKEPVPEEFESLFKESKVLITHCRLSRQKNLEAMLRIFAHLAEASHVKLFVIGDGELRESLMKYCKDLNLPFWASWGNERVDPEAKVFFTGQQRNPFKFLNRASVYLFTSHWEGFPLSLCEAVICGLQVVAADCFTGPREIIAPELHLPQPIQAPIYTKYGVLMPLADSDGAIERWAHEIQKLFKIESSKLKNNLSVDQISRFHISESIDQTRFLIN
jgi:glycosyltransferase involved in cell wall biosynthesis